MSVVQEFAGDLLEFVSRLQAAVQPLYHRSVLHRSALRVGDVWEGLGESLRNVAGYGHVDGARFAVPIFARDRGSGCRVIRW
jgi:hypothetical protein